MLAPLREIGEMVDDAIVDHIGNPIHGVINDFKSHYYREHGYSNSEMNHHVLRYLQEEANTCCKLIYEVAEQKESNGFKNMFVDFSYGTVKSWDRGAVWDAVLKQEPNILPSRWMEVHNLPSDGGHLCRIMMMALCYCCATAFQNHGFNVDVHEVSEGDWAMELSWN